MAMQQERAADMVNAPYPSRGQPAFDRGGIGTGPPIPPDSSRLSHRLFSDLR